MKTDTGVSLRKRNKITEDKITGNNGEKITEKKNIHDKMSEWKIG